MKIGYLRIIAAVSMGVGLVVASQVPAETYTNEQLIFGLSRAVKAADSAAVAEIGEMIDSQSHACAVRLGTIARLTTDSMFTVDQTLDYARASVDICGVPPSVMLYYVETVQSLADR